MMNTTTFDPVMIRNVCSKTYLDMFDTLDNLDIITEYLNQEDQDAKYFSIFCF